MTHGATGNRQVVLLGTAATTSRLHERLAGLDAIVIAEPVIALEPCAGEGLDDALRSLGADDLLVCLSPAAVTMTVRHAERLGIRETLALVSFACVGEGTAREGRAAGLGPARVAPGGTIASLIDDLLADPPGVRRIVIPRSALGDPVDADRLTAIAPLLQPVAYTNTAQPVDPARWEARLGIPLLLVFLSRSAVQALHGGLPGDLRDRLCNTAVCLAIGPPTAAALTANGWHVAGVADPPGLTALAALVPALLAQPAP